jgi:nicotinamidase-related amidase
VARRLHADESVLAVVDVQDGFLRKLPEDESAAVVDRIRWLCRLAGWLRVPVVVTEEEPERNGETAAPVFDLAACPEILADVSHHGRETIVVCGLETDVCVAQSALGLLEAGKRVFVVEDAVASPGTAHEQGLARMSRGGIELIGLKGLAYEWLATVERATQFGVATERDAPDGIVL